ncbi:flagella basal body P-ring formation protein FlgA [Aquaspirillum sp. LM1]|uniref:flagellar basal body P-ring formation chaperone FlgA n=1 Tax=Aquaspirillum sp. LM1 TaxID=1938604 RepID=UPI000983C530|nr:flagellar basal body P-ring formation chaperone FlgA [Aquaspirillum sp. LM1]AQR64446.1 flagella basal body P-ring formation protein FlgA [Aquaspirillum sp. LM1]
MKKLFVFLLVLLASLPALAAGTQDIAALVGQARQFAEASLSGSQARITVGMVDTRLRLPACATPLKPSWLGGRIEGNTAVDMACPSAGWNIRVPVKVERDAMVVVLRRSVSAGSTLTADDVMLVAARSNMAAVSVTDLNEAIGQTVTQNLSAGLILRRGLLRQQQIVRSGQKVQLVASDGSFQVGAEGVAMKNGSVGDVIGVRMPSGRVISGVVSASGSVEIRF